MRRDLVNPNFWYITFLLIHTLPLTMYIIDMDEALCTPLIKRGVNIGIWISGVSH